MPQLEEIWDKYNSGFPEADARELKLIKVPKMLPGTAAFPVSAGLIRKVGSEEIPPFSSGGVMFIANDPDSVDNYKNRAMIGISNGDQPNPMRYWKGVYRLLDQTTLRDANLSRSECFFTNVYPALREGKDNTGGSRPKSKFLDWCLSFLGKQISIMEPKLIVVFRREACKSIGIDGDESQDLVLSHTRLSGYANSMVQGVPIVCMWHPSRRPHPGYLSQVDLDKFNVDRLAGALRSRGAGSTSIGS